MTGTTALSFTKVLTTDGPRYVAQHASVNPNVSGGMDFEFPKEMYGHRLLTCYVAHSSSVANTVTFYDPDATSIYQVAHGSAQYANWLSGGASLFSGMHVGYNGIGKINLAQVNCTTTIQVILD